VSARRWSTCSFLTLGRRTMSTCVAFPEGDGDTPPASGNAQLRSRRWLGLDPAVSRPRESDHLRW
jgi:hypothetical protein